MTYRKLGFSLICLVPLSLAIAAEPEKTKTDTNREVVRTYSKVFNEANKFDQTDVLLTDYLNSEGGDMGLWLMLGQTQIKEKKFSQACYAFQKAATLSKTEQDHVFAEYSLADCMNEGGRPQDAKILLRKIVTEEIAFSDSAEVSLTLLNNGTILSGLPLPVYQTRTRGRFKISAAITSGFDTNVLLLEEDVANGVAIGDRGSFFISPGAQLSYSGKAWGNAYETRYIAAFTDYTNQAAKSFNSFYQRADLVLPKGKNRYGLFVDTYFLNKSTFSIYDWESGLSYGTSLISASEYSLTLDVPVQYQKYATDSSSLPENDRTGADVKVRATSRWAKGDAELISVQLGLDGQATKGSNYNQIGFDAPIQWVKPLPYIKNWGITNTFSAEAVGSDYYSSATKRRDVLFRVGAGAIKTFAKSWNTSLDYNYQKNTSNVQSAQYIKGVISLQISHELL